MYLGPVPEFLYVNSAVRRFSIFYFPPVLSRSLYLLTHSWTIFGSADI